MPARDIVHDLAEYTAAVRYEDLPQGAREAARKSILDTLGVALAASGLEPAAQGAIEIVEETGGRPQCTLLSSRARYPALMAAFGNGALVHCLDYDDLTPWGQHCSSSIVPAVFAVGERQDGACGKDVIAAVAAGQDIFARLLRNVGWKKDWNLSTALGVFAGTAAACRVMGLPAQKIANALGIATMQSSGIMEMVTGHGSDLRGLYAGFSAKGAVLAAMMAKLGTVGIERAFEGKNGVFSCYFDGEFDRDAILDGLGRDYLGAATIYKRWPCVGTAHGHLKAALDIVVENNLAMDDIARIRLHAGDYHEFMCQPLEQRRKPETAADARFSLPFLVSLVIVRRGMSVTDFTRTGLADPQVLECGRKVDLVSDPSLDWKVELPPGRVDIVATDGRSWSRERHSTPDDDDKPMSWDEICAKFRTCASVARNPLSRDQLARAERLALELENLSDATVLIRSLT